MKLKDIRDKLLKGDFSALLLSAKDGGRKGGSSIHPSEVAHLLDGLPAGNAVLAFGSFPEATQLAIFPYLEGLMQKKIIRELPQPKAALVLNGLTSDDRLTFFHTLNGMERSQMLELLSGPHKDETQDLLGYPEQSVARLINTDFATIHGGMSVAEAGEHLRRRLPDTEAANVIYVVDEKGRLVDDIPIRRLLLSDQSKTIEQIMDGYCVSLHISDKADDVVDKFRKYDRDVLPVVNDEEVLLGVVTVDDVMDVAERRDTREMQKFGGVEGLDYPYVKTPFFSLIKKRAGWLIVLFLGEMLTATAMGYFEHEIEKAVMLALFVPLIISSGGNSGSQAATLIIRAMAVKELNLKNWFYVMRREFLSGLTLGVVLGAIGFLRITAWQQLRWYNYGPHWLLLAITIFFSLIGIVMWGTLSGAMIPMILKKLKQDPAASSAPFVATLVDVTGLVIYFTVAAIILRGTLL